MPEDLYININNVLQPSEDYNALRKEGIKLIEKLSGKVWTDYNAHDPGITILEALCYALTDLGYRTSFDIRDILTPVNGQEDWKNIFYTCRQILSTNPVTITDYRKLVIDTEGVKNAWIQVSNEYEVLLYLNAKDTVEGEVVKSYELAYSTVSDIEPLRLKGLYKVTVEYEEDIIAGNKQEQTDDAIRKKLHVHRNLGEDFLSIRPVNYELFKMNAEIRVKEGADIDKINAQIFQVINNFFSPPVKFYTLDQMREEGYSAEEIFDGPPLKNGFIDANKLERSEGYMDVHLSDIIRLISDIPGVIAVKKCIFPIETQTTFLDFTKWISMVRVRERVPKLDIENSTISFTRSGDRHRSESEKQPVKERVKAIYSFLQSELGTPKLKNVVNDVEVPMGEYMDIAEYYPFQFSLPSIYGMHEKITDQGMDQAAIESLATTDVLKIRSRQILQLRGFLMVFEQIMADYLSQLANIRQLFSFDPSIEQTYFPQALEGIHDMKLLFINFKNYQDNILKLYGTNKISLNRRNAMLSHLMARVGETPGDYAPPNPDFNKNNLTSEIKNKARILSEYISISAYRGNGFDYSNHDQVWNTDNVAGMKRRICRLLGIENSNTTSITSQWLTIEKLDRPGDVTWSRVVLKDPDHPDNILLESKEYKSETEIREVLKLILHYGFNKDFYEIDEKQDKYSHKLKRHSQATALDSIAEREFNNKPAFVAGHKKTIETLFKFAHSENFHILEHILLRPKLNPQETDIGQDSGGIIVKAVNLLSVTNIPDIDFPAVQKTSYTSYNFRVKTVKDPEQNNKIYWQLSLRKGRTEVVVSEDKFDFESDSRQMIERIREIATNDASYIRKRDKVKDNRSSFSITDNSKIPAQVLAISKNSYEKEEVMEEEIRSLIQFFSYETGLLADKEGEPVNISSIADPYSLRVSIFVPAWPVKFRDPSFRHLFEKAVYLETPAHIYPDVYWLDYREMQDFENVYKPWLGEIAANEIPDTVIVNNLINLVNEIRQHY